MRGRKLGRGLDILLDKAKGGGRRASGADSPGAPTGDSGVTDRPGDVDIGRESAPSVGPEDGSEVVRIAVEHLRPNPQQPRSTFSRKELEALKSSVDREGILQPVLVRRAEDGFEIVAGERRFRAAEELGLSDVPAIVIEVEDARLLELALIENLHREDLNPIETAKAFEGLVGLKGWTQDELAAHLGVGRPTVSNTLRLLELSEGIQAALRKGQIQMGHAKILLSVSGAREREQLFEKIAEDRLSVRELEIAREAAERKLGGKPTRSGGGGGGRTTSDKSDKSDRSRKRRQRRSRSGAEKSADTLQLEDELSQALGVKVTIREKKGRGVVSVEFYSPDDFQEIRRRLLGMHE